MAAAQTTPAPTVNMIVETIDDLRDALTALGQRETEVLDRTEDVIKAKRALRAREAELLFGEEPVQPNGKPMTVAQRDVWMAEQNAQLIFVVEDNERLLRKAQSDLRMAQEEVRANRTILNALGGSSYQ